MPQAKNGLAEKLNRLATETSSEKRVELLRHITETFNNHSDRCTSAEQYLFNEVVTLLLDRLGLADRVEASERLSKVSNLPQSLTQRLATDPDIDVARPIIRDYEKIPERVLIDVAKKGSQAHLTVIAGRATVTPPVSDIVVVRGEGEAIRTLASNKGARFSTFGMEKLIDKASKDRVLQELVVSRSDLSLAAVSKLLPVISDELVARLRGALTVDAGEVEWQLVGWMRDRKENAERTQALIERIQNNDLSANDVIMQLVGGKRLFDAASVVAAVLKLDRFQVFNLMTGGSIQSALLLLRAVDVSWRVADAFIQLRIAKAVDDNYEAPPTRRDYLAIERASAQRVVRFMKAQKSMTESLAS